MRMSTCLLPKVFFALVFGLALMVSQLQLAHAQADGVVPASHQSGSFFNSQLGTALRFNYHTQGYGTQDDVFSLGGMKVIDLDGATLFFDGQGTLSDDFGGGFNLGTGYRQLTSTGMSIDPERILGVGFWTDGQSSSSDNFFTQLGFSLESLGESFDLRLNGHFPLQRTKNGDAELAGAGTPFYDGNNIFSATEAFTVDTAHSVVDGEFAKRINDLEAWAFIGGYQLGGGGVDATGYRLGVRGYAVPDLALSLQVTDDDQYATNVMFGVTWFIGRTHKGNMPSGTIMDRFREPVIRNDFIAMTSRQETRASGSALTETGSTDAIRVVHIDSTDGTSAAGGGDGTFENPFADVSDVDASVMATADNSMDGDIILVHSGSTLTGTATLRDDQSLFGEGVDQDMNEIPHIVSTNELGNINLPETATDALTGARPIFTAAGADPITLANNNTVNNFTINGAGTAVTANAVEAPTLANLQINGVATGLSLNNVTGATLVENTVEINGATATGVDINLGTDTMSIAAAINDSTGTSLSITNRLGGTIDYTGTIDDQATVATTSQGVVIDGNTDSTINITNTQNILVGDGQTAIAATNNVNSTVNASGAVDLTATGTGQALLIDGNDVDSSITFADLMASAVNGDTVTVNDGGTVTVSSADDTRTIANTGTGRAFVNEGHLVDADRNATATINSNITNSGGGTAVEVMNRSANDLTIAGTVDVAGGSGAGVFVHDNVDGNILFTNALTLDTGTFDAVVLMNNSDGTTDATISFGELDIDTTDGDGFRATGTLANGGGNLLVSNVSGNPNTIDVAGAGVGLTLTNMTIDTGGVAFDEVNVDNDGGADTDPAISLQNLDGTGLVAIGGGTDPGDGGQLSTDGTAILVDNADNVQIDNLTVTNTGAGQGIEVTGQQTGSSAVFNGLVFNTANADAVNINGNADGTVTFNTVTATTSGTGDGIDISNADGSTVAININDATVNANGTGRGFAATGGGDINVGGTNEMNSAGATAFVVNDVEDLSASNVTIANTTQQGVSVTGQDTAGDSVTLTNFDVTTTGADAVTVANNTNGSVILNSLTAESGNGDTVLVNNNTGSTVSFNNLNAEATGSGDTFTATGGGTLLATGTNNVTANTGVGVNIQDMIIDGANVAFANVDVTAGSGDGVTLANNTGGRISVNGGSLTTDTAAFNITNSDNVTISGVDIDNTTTIGAGVVASNAAGDTLTMTNVDVMTSSGAGVQVAGGTFTANGTNTIETTTGTALDIQNTTIGGGGAAFNTVDVNGATNGVVLANLTGGQVRVGGAAATGTDGAGGTLTTTGDAIQITGVTNAIFNDVEISTSGGQGVTFDHTSGAQSTVTFNNLALTVTGGAGDGVTVTDNGTGEVDFTLRDSTIDVTAANSIGFNLITNANTGEVDIRLDNNTIIAANNSAVAADLTAGTGDVQFLVNGGNEWTNNSAGSSTADFVVSTDRTLNATIGDQDGTAPFDENRFTNTNAGGIAFSATSNSGAATLNLDIRGNTASGGANDYVLTETLGNFGVIDLTETVTNGTNNAGLFDLGGGVEADFTDLGAGPIKQVD